MKRTERFAVVARAVIIRRGMVLLAVMKSTGVHFLPGGHVEPGETTEHALHREAREEFSARLSSVSFLGACENHYLDRNGVRYHEYNVVFSAQIDREVITANEQHLTFVWKPVRNLSRTRIMPHGMAPAVSRALKTKKPFWFVARES